MLWPPTLRASGFEIGNWPRLESWAARLKAMPGFLPYDLIPSLSTTSRVLLSGKRMKPAIHDFFWYGQPMRTTRINQ